MSKNHPILAFLLQFSRAAIAAITIVLLSRWLGATQRGELSLVLFAINLIMVANEFIGGSSLGNLVVSYPLNRLVPFSKLWGLVVCVVGALIYYAFTRDSTLTLYLLIVALPLSWLTIHYNLYQGFAAANTRNILQLLLEIAKLLGVIWLAIIGAALVVNRDSDFSFWNQQSLRNEDVLLVYAITTTGVLVISCILLFRKLLSAIKGDTRPVLELITSGFWAQNGQLVQFLNYRLNLVLLTAILIEKSHAGIYANALVIADAIWIFGNSFGSIAHMRMLQSTNRLFHADITLRYAVISFVGTGLACIVLFCIPNFVFVNLFGPDFESLRSVTLMLIPAILALGASTLFSHYFHATNQFKTLLSANLSGLVVQVILAVMLIPDFGIIGACVAADAGFIVILIVLLYIFRKQNPDAHLRGKFSLRAIWGTLRNSEIDISRQSPDA